MVQDLSAARPAGPDPGASADRAAPAIPEGQSASDLTCCAGTARAGDLAGCGAGLTLPHPHVDGTVPRQARIPTRPRLSPATAAGAATARTGLPPSAGLPGAVPVLRGRTREITTLSTLLLDAERGTGGLLVIEGAPGSGKTRLLEEARLTAGRRGLRVCQGGGTLAGHTAPLGPVLAAFSSGDDPLFDARQLNEVARMPNPGFWVLQELRGRLERAAETAPVVVLVDDVQWCDETSLLVLRSLPTALAASPVVWIFAERTAGPAGYGRAAGARLGREGGRRIRLDPLDDRAIRNLAFDTFGAVPDRAILDLTSPAEGKPLLLRELFEGLRDEGTVEVRSGRARLTGTQVPKRFDESIRHRLSHVSQMARDFTEAASVLGRSCSVDLMVDLLAVPPASLVHPLREILTAELMVESDGRVAFRHDLVREAVARAVPAARRRALQRLCVDLQLARGVPVTDVAAMLCECAEPGDREAVALLAHASDGLAPRAPAAAAALSAGALRLLPGNDPARPRMIADTVSLLWLGGDHARALELAESAFGEPGTLDPETEARLRLDLAGLTSQQSFGEAVRQGRLGDAVEGASAGLKAGSQALLALHLTRGGSLDEAHRTAVRARDLARSAGRTAAEVTALVAESIVAFMRADWQRADAASNRAVLLARDVDPAEIPYTPGMWAVRLLTSHGFGQQAVNEAEEGVRLARRHGRAAAMHFWSMERARLLLDAGHLAEARAEAERVVAMAEQLGSAEFTDITVRYPVGVLAMHTGDRQGVRKAVRDAGEMMRDESAFVSRFGAWLAAQAAEWEGDSVEALRLMPRETELFDAFRPEYPVPLDPMDQPVFVRIALRAGDRERAAEAVLVARQRAAANPEFASLAAAAAHAHGLLEDDAALLAEAVELYRGSQRPIAVASACEDAGRALLRTVPDRASPYLERALRLYEECGATWHAARVRRRLAPVGSAAQPVSRTRSRSTGWAGLSRGELRVVRLVAAGAANREVAERLFVSPHTVNTYVRRSFKKLGISSRVELVRIAREQDHEGMAGS
ncbi:AAA family ATPase [Streptomyces sp. NPDC048211]|uniref:helix-turn-helix transcriptional regulator n=1 Tax=Streptomyces sp. NPDC048211 TaxID=3365516 RepID=UPI003720D6FB